MKKILMLCTFFTYSISSVLAAEHTHFDTEKVKPGVVLYRDYRSNSNACQNWDSNQNLSCPSSSGGYYDSELDGFVLEIVPSSNGQLHQNKLMTNFAPVTNELWVQWEMYIEQQFMDDLPNPSDDGKEWVNNKVFSFHNDARLGCDKKSLETLFAQYQPYNSSKNLEFQGSEDVCGGATIKLFEFNNWGDQWLRYTYKINFNTKRTEVWRTTMDGDTVKVGDMVRSGLTVSGVDGCGPLSHSTSLQHHPDSNHPTYRQAYRNMIVSTQPIAFTTGSIPPPAQITGDVNDDEVINVLDVQACVSHILGVQDWGSAADVNEDGSVDVLDVQAIIEIILG